MKDKEEKLETALGSIRGLESRLHSQEVKHGQEVTLLNEQLVLASSSGVDIESLTKGKEQVDKLEKRVKRMGVISKKVGEELQKMLEDEKSQEIVEAFMKEPAKSDFAKRFLIEKKEDRIRAVEEVKNAKCETTEIDTQTDEIEKVKTEVVDIQTEVIAPNTTTIDVQTEEACALSQHEGYREDEAPQSASEDLQRNSLYGKLPFQ